jgi:oligopeptidase B
MSELSPPQARVFPTPLTHQNDTRIDDYYWMRERTNPDTLAYLEAENAYTQHVMRSTEELQKTLYDEMLGHIEEDDSEPPYPRGSFFYYKRTEKGKPYPLHCRKKSDFALEEVLLDENVLAEGHQFFALGNLEVSPGGNLLAYSTDIDGDEVFVTCIRDLATGSDLPDRIEGTYYSLAWTAGNNAIYYVTLDEAKRPYRVWCHRLGSSDDVLVYEETDRRFEVELHKSRDGRHIFIRSESKVTSEFRFAPAAAPLAPFQIVWPRRQDILYEVEARGDEFYILTNWNAQEFRLMLCSAKVM